VFHILHRGDQRKGAIATVEFEGEPYGAGVSLLSAQPSARERPGTASASYAETCIVLSGQAAMVVDGDEVVAGAGRHSRNRVGDVASLYRDR
jgi:hypothetical protein